MNFIFSLNFSSKVKLNRSNNAKLKKNSELKVKIEIFDIFDILGLEKYERPDICSGYTYVTIDVRM